MERHIKTFSTKTYSTEIRVPN